jgi:hypothetical protein
MKAFSITSQVAVLFLICSYSILAQTAETKLNQIDLMKKMAGSWRCNTNKDTTAFWDAVSYDTGLLVYNKYLTKGNLFVNGKELYGYDKSIDKFIDAGVYKRKGIGVYLLWFISDNKYVVIPYRDISNPEQASFRMEGEFTTPDVIVETEIVKNKQVRTDTWTRVKE